MTLRDDLALELERIRTERDLTFKDVLNQALEQGVIQMRGKPEKERKSFKIRTFDLGKPLFRNTEELKNLIADLDEEEDLRKIGLR